MTERTHVLRRPCLTMDDIKVPFCMAALINVNLFGIIFFMPLPKLESGRLAKSLARGEGGGNPSYKSCAVQKS